ncbi:MAG: iron-containing alcohol dehydrogenase [Polyangiaceae bacterium]|nr:iron-containing alcohol dehydrogenase [Polyangiaceae bacterium]
MTDKPQSWSLDELQQKAERPIAVVASPSTASVARELLPYPHYSTFDAIPQDTAALVVVGGGALMDAAKMYKHQHLPSSQLVAIPSLWGSGAEVSPVVVSTENGKKEFAVDDAFIPDAWVILPDLVKALPEHLAHYGCGDAWSHVLEGALSPLASEELRNEGALLIKEMLTTKLSKDIAWFELSARACRLQSSSSVGLIHGIAHALEPTLRKAHPDDGWGHAKLCSILILPVMKLCQQSSSKWSDFAKAQSIDQQQAEGVWTSLFDQEAFQQLLPHLEANWLSVLRNPLTRTNHAMVRRKDIQFFLAEDFT